MRDDDRDLFGKQDDVAGLADFADLEDVSDSSADSASASASSASADSAAAFDDAAVSSATSASAASASANASSAAAHGPAASASDSVDSASNAAFASRISHTSQVAQSAQVTQSTQVAQATQISRSSRKPKKSGLLDIVSRIISAFFAIVLVVGLGLIAYPTVADWWNRMHQSRAVATYVEKTEDLSGAQRKVMLEAARAYNAELAGRADRWRPTDEETEQYESILDITGTGVMGYVSIPKLKVQLPIYHGTDEGILQIAIGHLESTSLPVGGKGTHAAISGHTGLPSAKLLTGLDTLQKGDTFAFHVLGETYTYQVDQISVVLPNDLSKLNIESDKDLATVITCTPYGVNSHRLLVRGHRIPNPTTPDTTDYESPLRVTLIIMIAVAAAVLACTVLLVIRAVRHRPRGLHTSQ